MREDDETTLDVVLSREHGCTKQLLEAEQILHSLLQEDQRMASVWGMWGEVLALLGNREKAAEAMLTSLEWSEVNGFESVSRYPVVIWRCLIQTVEYFSNSSTISFISFLSVSASLFRLSAMSFFTMASMAVSSSSSADFSASFSISSEPFVFAS